MNAPARSKLRLIGKESLGQFAPGEWLAEADALFSVSSFTRKAFEDQRHEFGTSGRRMSLKYSTESDWSLLIGLPRASLLTLCHSMELFMKAAMNVLYFGCREEMFTRDIRKNSHKLDELAEWIGFPLNQKDRSDLMFMRRMLFQDVRYPPTVPSGTSEASIKNRRTSEIWDSESYHRYSLLVNRVREYAIKLRGTEDDPLLYGNLTFEGDGYVAWRSGGGTKPQIVCRYSSSQRNHGNASIDVLKAMFDTTDVTTLLGLWNSARILQDEDKSTLLVADPP